jgi:hypothetical protein
MAVGSALAQYWAADGNNVVSTFSGNLGVGTNYPDAKLHVKGGDLLIEASSFTTGIILLDKESPTNKKITLCSPVWTQLVSGMGCDAGILMTSSALGGNAWKIFRDGSSDLFIQETFTYPPGVIDAMVVQAGTGSIGIGTTTPEERVHVVGNVKIEADPNDSSYRAPLTVIKEGEGSQLAAVFRNPEDQNGEVRIQMGVGGNGPMPLTWDWIISAGNGTFNIGSINILQPVLNLMSSGRLGIGVSQPSYGLQLPNTSYAEGTVMARSYMYYSSKRFKTNIIPIENALDKVQQLTGVSFDWKDQCKHDIGLIAEDVGWVVPEVVVYEANGKDASSLDYSKLVALLIEATKEQQAKINELEQAVANTKQLEQRIEALERLIQQQQMPWAW